MSGDGSDSQPRNGPRRTFLGWLVTLPFQAFGLLVGSLVLALLIECIGMRWFWPDESWHHAQNMFAVEMEQISSQFARSLLSDEPAQAAERFIENVFDVLFVDSGVVEQSASMAERAREQVPHGKGFKAFFSALAIDLEIYVRAGAYTALTFLARLVVLALTLPLFVLSAWVGLVDGLVQRDIRRFGAVYESGFVHHRAKALIVPLALAPWTLYLALPVSVHPLVILLPSAALFGLAVSLTTASFKKYL